MNNNKTINILNLSLVYKKEIQVDNFISYLYNLQNKKIIKKNIAIEIIIFIKYLIEDKNMEQIGYELNISRERVRQIYSKGKNSDRNKENIDGLIEIAKKNKDFKIIKKVNKKYLNEFFENEESKFYHKITEIANRKIKLGLLSVFSIESINDIFDDQSEIKKGENKFFYKGLEYWINIKDVKNNYLSLDLSKRKNFLYFVATNLLFNRIDVYEKNEIVSKYILFFKENNYFPKSERSMISNLERYGMLISQTSGLYSINTIEYDEHKKEIAEYFYSESLEFLKEKKTIIFSSKIIYERLKNRSINYFSEIVINEYWLAYIFRIYLSNEYKKTYHSFRIPIFIKKEIAKKLGSSPKSLIYQLLFFINENNLIKLNKNEIINYFKTLGIMPWIVEQNIFQSELNVMVDGIVSMNNKNNINILKEMENKNE